MTGTRRSLIALGLVSSIVLVTLIFQNCSGKFSSALGGSSTQASSVPPGGTSLDGNYTLSSWSCGPIDLLNALGPASVNINLQGSSGTQVINFPDSCALTTQLSVSYPDGLHINVTGSNTTCSAACAPAECVPNPSANEFTLNFAYIQ